MLSKKTIRAIAAAIAVILVVTIAGGSLISAIGTAQAASVKDLKGKISSLDSQKAEIQKVIDDLEGQIGGNLKKMEALKDRMELTKQDINATETVIVRLSDEIETKKEEIVVAQEELDEKTEIFETRMRVMYENGNDISYLDVILGSNSFGEMLSRLEIVSEIMEGDKKVVSDYKEAKQTLEDAKAALEQDKEDQETYKSTLESKYDDLVSQKQEIQELTNKLESDQAAKQKEEDAIDAEKDRINAEIEEISRREAEAARKAAEEAKKNQQSGGGNSGGGASYTGNGDLSVWPAPSGTANTSSYGWRTHPVYGTRKFHKGLDISAPGGSPVLAAASGTVSKSYYSSSYGNYIVISHGGGLMTGYAHMSSRMVSAGERVSAGQQIGKVGSTGISTGNHLHFEVYVNGSTTNPMNYY
ncbi:MAG: peptidoglycan DD-metalloendopeptidase family protein [Clostridiaceae bacterium]|jgi:murein DD-endopeptidase MepM/ murein hydrolase activator NlpD|nr:peptidoglycan DD-metalloendopeptidase family protein [Butyricicoccus pullicaecorum]MBS7223845.1 peptidoglycan DD-metalloendopeptidase family protein [Clostridiaceae bacterium]